GALADTPFGSDISQYLVGEADLARGRVSEALASLDRARHGLEAYGDAGGWRYPRLVAWGRGLALADRTDEGPRAVGEAAGGRQPGVRMLSAAELLAGAWVAAAEGAVTEARTTATQAARQAAGSGLLGFEVLAWQTTISFGGTEAAVRLSELASIVEGPRARL